LHAQLNTTFEKMFNRILLEDRFNEPGFGDVFANAAERANQFLTPVMNNLITANVSSFPLTSTIAGISFDMSSGAPEMTMGSLGPIFAETAETLGPLNINVGMSYSFYNLSRIRGLPVDGIRFSIPSDDLTGDGTLGDIPEEVETIDIFPNMDINAHVGVFSAAAGILNNLDIGIAVPFVNLTLRGQASGVINSVSFFELGAAINNYNNDPFNPVLVTQHEYKESVSNLGDIALKLKFAFLRDQFVDMALFGDVRLPTGKSGEFLGTGKTNVKIAWIMSKKTDNSGAHLNFGYDRRGADFDSDEFEIKLGFEQKFTEWMTSVGGILAEFDLENSTVVFPESAIINAQIQKFPLPAAATDIEVPITNIRNSTRDHFVNASLGLKLAASYRFSGFANILIPLNDGGLRAGIVPTFGLAYTF
jgi:hypothetical protein